MSEANEVVNDPGILVPGERAEVESRARDQGWVSEDEFKSDERNVGKKWRPAEEFLERGELFDTIKSLKGEIHSIKRDFSLLTQHHKDVAKVEYERAIAELKAQRAVAAKEGDTEAIVELSDKIEEVKEGYQAQKKEQKADATQLHPAYAEWIRENNWYTTDTALHGAADAVAQDYMQKNPNSSFEDVLSHVTKEIKTKFMDKPKRTATVESGSNGATPRGKSKLSKADLSDDEREIMRTFIRRGVFNNEQEYIDELAKVKGL